MNAKQIILTLIVLFAIDSVAMSQVKKQYRDEVHKSTTVVIKEEGANDFDILNNQFNLDDYKVNEQIKITTDQPLSSAPILPKNVSGAPQDQPPAPDLSNATALAAPNYERPKTKMKRWSVREKKGTSSEKETLVKEKVEKDLVPEISVTVSEKPARTERIRKAKKTTSRKYKKKKKVKRKKRLKKLKNRKRKTKRKNKLGCYKF